ncbi:MAG: hypothetical protein IKC02_04995, partial [Oscillospiraceae bacterium]|nr:hypothetical protein [Oscillospiraceae bacterium]
GTVIVFSGSPKARFHYAEAFSFLNESRKEQLVRLLKESGNLPVYLLGDDEVYMKAGYLPDGKLVCAIFNTGFDPMEEIRLCIEQQVGKVERLDSSGAWEACAFEQTGETLTVAAEALTLQPVILKISE